MNKMVTKKRFITLFLTSMLIIAQSSEAAKFNVLITPKARVTDDEKVEEAFSLAPDGDNVTTTTETTTETCDLTLTLKPKGTAPADLMLKWCFITEDAKTEELQVSNCGSKALELKDGVVATEKITGTFSTVETVRVEDGSNNDKETHVGESYEGFLVLVTSGSEVLAKKANSSRYTKDEWVEKCINPPAPKKASKDSKGSSKKAPKNKKKK